MTTRSRRRRAYGNDAGVNQSAFVALLVVVILVIAMSLTVFGPRLGGVVANYLICTILADNPKSCTPPSTNQIQGVGGTSGTDGTVVSTTDLGPDCGAAQAQLAGLLPDGKWNIQQLTALGMSVPIGIQPGIHYDDSITGTWSIVDCQLVLKTDKDYGHRDDALTRIDWGAIGRGIAAGMIGLAASAAMAIVCAAAALGPICPYLVGFTIGFFWNLSSALIETGTLDGTAVIKAFAFGVIAALPAGTKYLEPLGEALPGMLRAMGERIALTGRTMWAWVRAIAGPGLESLGGWLGQAARYFEEHPLRDLPPVTQ